MWGLSGRGGRVGGGGSPATGVAGKLLAHPRREVALAHPRPAKTTISGGGEVALVHSRLAKTTPVKAEKCQLRYAFGAKMC